MSCSLIFYMTSEEKCFCYILLPDQILLSDCFCKVLSNICILIAC